MTIKEYRISLGLRIRRVIAKRMVRLVFQTAGRVKVTGAENIPRGKPYVAAINHISIYDPPLVLALWPETLEAVGAVDVFDKPFQGDLLRIYGVIPVHRGQYDRELIDIMFAILRAGHPLMIAPEGTRSHGSGLQQAKSGVGYVLAQAAVPVLPIGIVGTTDDLMKKAMHFQRPSVEIRIGRPFSLPPIEGTGPARRLARQRDADLVMQHIAGLLPSEYRGVYAASAIQP